MTYYVDCLLNLPLEILHNIIVQQTLTIYDWGNLRLTCHHLNDVCKAHVTHDTIVEFSDNSDQRFLQLPSLPDQTPLDITTTREPSSFGEFLYNSSNNRGNLRIPTTDLREWIIRATLPSYCPSERSELFTGIRRLLIIVDSAYFNAAAGTERFNNLSDYELYPHFMSHILPQLVNLKQLDLLVRAYADNLSTTVAPNVHRDATWVYNLRLMVIEHANGSNNSTDGSSIDYGGLKRLTAGASRFECSNLPLRELAKVPTRGLLQTENPLKVLKSLTIDNNWYCVGRNTPFKPSINFLVQFENLTVLDLGIIPDTFYYHCHWIPATLHTLRIKDIHRIDSTFDKPPYLISNVRNLSIFTFNGRFFQHYQFDNLEQLTFTIAYHAAYTSSFHEESVFQSTMLRHIHFYDVPLYLISSSLSNMCVWLNPAIHLTYNHYIDNNFLLNFYTILELESPNFCQISGMFIEWVTVQDDHQLVPTIVEFLLDRCPLLERLCVSDILMFLRDQPWVRRYYYPGTYVFNSATSLVGVEVNM